MTRRKLHDSSSINHKLFVDRDTLRESVEMLVRNVLEDEVERYIGAARYERSEGRRASRNGSKARTMQTSVGRLEFEVPQVREGGFRTQVFDKWQRSDRALVVAVQEMYVQGVSTRKVSAVLEQMGGAEMSAATVSRCAAELDEQVQAFRMRRLDDKLWPCLVVDARYEKVRKRGRVVSQAVLVVAGVTSQGQREILGLWCGDSESELTWGEAFADLKARGLSGVHVIVSDAHKGIQAAVARHFQGSVWQRCKVHWMREAVKKVSWRDEKQLIGDLRQIFAHGDREHCLRVAGEVASSWRERNGKLADWIEESAEQCLAVWDLPHVLRRRLNSTNMLERLMRELKRRSRVVSIFPSEQSVIRLLGAILIEIDEKWSCEHGAYLNPEALQAMEMPS